MWRDAEVLVHPIFTPAEKPLKTKNQKINKKYLDF